MSSFRLLKRLQRNLLCLLQATNEGQNRAKEQDKCYRHFVRGWPSTTTSSEKWRRAFQPTASAPPMNLVSSRSSWTRSEDTKSSLLLTRWLLLLISPASLMWPRYASLFTCLALQDGLCPAAKVPVVEPPKPIDPSASQATATLELKLSKPSLSYSLSDVALNSPVSTVKEQLVLQERSRAPPAADMKWLIKGKVLNDDKLLSDYVESGALANITIMLKPGAAPFPANTVLPDPEPAQPPQGQGNAFKFPSTESPSNNNSSSSGPSPSLMPKGPSGSGRSHMRVPSLTLNTSHMELDPAQQQPATSHRRSPSLSTQFQSKVTDPAFWEATHQFLQQHFGSDDANAQIAADRLWETWFGASKSWLTPNEVARVRDSIGLTAMGGSGFSHLSVHSPIEADFGSQCDMFQSPKRNKNQKQRSLARTLHTCTVSPCQCICTYPMALRVTCSWSLPCRFWFAAIRDWFCCPKTNR